MKKKIMLSSILTIVLCACLIAGSTFALFTDIADTSIAITSGNVKLTATVIGEGDNTYAALAPVLYSIEGADAQTPGAFPVYDDNLDETFYYVETGALQGNVFPNGGIASVENGVVTFTNITPGDKMEFNVAVSSESNVKTKIRYIIKPGAGITASLLEGFTVSYGDNEFYLTADGVVVSDWISVDAAADGQTVDFASDTKLGIKLNPEADNRWMNQSFSFVVLVEAVQDNALPTPTNP